jgi:phosphatidylethanolamine-binding protein (PEBP) family uncharacterized protein
MNNKTMVYGAILALLLPLTGYANQTLQLSSPDFDENGSLGVRFTCEGEGISPALEWSGVPDGAQSLVVIMDHQPMDPLEPRSKEPSSKDSGPEEPRPQEPSRNALPIQVGESPQPSKPKGAHRPEGLHWYWTLYNIAPNLSGVAADEVVGTIGTNSVNRHAQYAPPCSKGPGPKRYSFHLYALSEVLTIASPECMTEATLRQAFKGLVLDESSISVYFERSLDRPRADMAPPPRPEHPDLALDAICKAESHFAVDDPLKSNL